MNDGARTTSTDLSSLLRWRDLAAAIVDLRGLELLLVRMRRSRHERASLLALVAAGLVGARRFLDVAEAMLDEANALKPTAAAFEQLARIAHIRGETRRAAALRRMASQQIDAPTPADRYREAWVKREIRTRQKKQGETLTQRRQRLATYRPPK